MDSFSLFRAEEAEETVVGPCCSNLDIVARFGERYLLYESATSEGGNSFCQRATRVPPALYAGKRKLRLSVPFQEGRQARPGVMLGRHCTVSGW